MKQLKPVIQEAADRMNDSAIADNILAIKTMVAVNRDVTQAISKHQKQTTFNNEDNIIVTGDEIRKAMEREIENPLHSEMDK